MPLIRPTTRTIRYRAPSLARGRSWNRLSEGAVTGAMRYLTVSTNRSALLRVVVGAVFSAFSGPPTRGRAIRGRT